MKCHGTELLCVMERKCDYATLAYEKDEFASGGVVKFLSLHYVFQEQGNLKSNKSLLLYYLEMYISSHSESSPW